MYLLETDCIIYKANKEILANYIYDELISKDFEEYKTRNLAVGVIEITFSWLDPIKIMDKMVIKDRKEVVMWFFVKESVLVTWCSSECYIGHALRRLESKLNIKYIKLDIFKKAKNPLVFNTFAQLTSIHILNDNLKSYEDDDALSFNKRILLQDISNQEYSYYVNESLLTSLTFKYINGNFYFYIDNQSIISFPEAMKVVDVINVLERIVKKIK